jgi:dihydrofolate synthase / folylpolyglutamate synthase
MNYQDTLSYLSGIHMMGVKPELNTTRVILSHLTLGEPLARLRIIQVAGTNGKGSTTHFLSSIFRVSGYRVGQFTSPHLHDVRERIVIDNQWVSEELFSRAIHAVRETAQQLMSCSKIDRMPTYFEYTFLAAIYCFSLQSVEIVLLEVGLGGRWDATSAITPDVAVITTISRDHTRLLGTKLRDIAAEKAGIIKKSVPVVCGCAKRTVAFQVIRAVAEEHEAPFFPVLGSGNRLQIGNDQPPYECSYKAVDSTSSSFTYSFDIRLNGVHQTYNAATAIKVIRVFAALFEGRFSISSSQVSEGIRSGFIPGRIETIEAEPPIILDGGHNIQSIIALTKYLEVSKKHNLTLLFGVLEDKNYARMIRILLPYVDRVVLTRPQSDRALSPRKMVNHFNRGDKKHNVLIRNNINEAYNTACRFRQEVLITGSFYLVGAIRQIIMNAVNLKTSRRV